MTAKLIHDWDSVKACDEGFVVASALEWLDRDGVKHTIFPPFGTDFASVPWVARWYIGRTGRHQRAALVHDGLYYDAKRVRDLGSLARSAYRCSKDTGEVAYRYNRRWADDQFLDLMRALRVPLHQRAAAYWAVRLFGWIYWNRSA